MVRKSAPTPPPVEEKTSSAQVPSTKNRWQNVLENFSTTSTFLRPKEGRTRIRIWWEESDDDLFYREVVSSFRGNQKTRYLITALPLDGPGITDEMTGKIIPVIINKTILKEILNLLAEEHELWGDDGHGLSITRTGSGLDSSYAVTISKNPVEIPEDVEYPELTLDQLAVQFETWANRQRATPDEEEESAAAPARKTNSSQVKSKW